LTVSLQSSAQEQSWTADVFYENDTHYRGKDYTGDTIGLSKFRNTLQADIKGGLETVGRYARSCGAPMMAFTA